MALIDSPRLKPGDREAWEQAAAGDLARASTARFEDLVDEAATAIIRFAREPCYAGVSWGKDSVVVAHLVTLYAPHVTLAWVRKVPSFSPECERVRDAFLARCPGALYLEVDVGPEPRSLSRGAKIIERRHGARRITGVRAAESAQRRRAARIHGAATARVCNPLQWWATADVFAYLALYDMPVHPAYAMTFGGTWDRERLRVAPLGGSRGLVYGRAEWERAYYPDYAAQK